MNSIIFSSSGHRVEGIAPTGGIQPGRFCRWYSSVTQFILEYEGGGDLGRETYQDIVTGMIAVEKSIIGKGIEDDYVEGEQVFLVIVKSGDVVYARTPAGYPIGTVLGPDNETPNGLLITGAIDYTNMCVSLAVGSNMGDGTFLTKVQIF